MEKVGALYAEVRKVMVKVANGTSRRVNMLGVYVKAKKFIERSEKVCDFGQFEKFRFWSLRLDLQK